jgi:hypothetical protein
VLEGFRRRARISMLLVAGVSRGRNGGNDKYSILAAKLTEEDGKQQDPIFQ